MFAVSICVLTVKRKLNEERGTLARLSFDSQCAVKKRGSLSNALKAEAFTILLFRQVEADAIVLDDYP